MPEKAQMSLITGRVTTVAAFKKSSETLNLAFETENLFNAARWDREARELDDALYCLDVFVRVAARTAWGAHRSDKPQTLVAAERLGMHACDLRDDRDHIDVRCHLISILLESGALDFGTITVSVPSLSSASAFVASNSLGRRKERSRRPKARSEIRTLSVGSGVA